MIFYALNPACSSDSLSEYSVYVRSLTDLPNSLRKVLVIEMKR